MPTLAKGVTLHVIPTKKYKTVRIYIRFNSVLNKETITKRTLLSSILETNSLRYPDQTKLNEALAELYGASFGLDVSKKGNLHWLNLSMNLVNDKYIGQSIFTDAVAFIKEILFFPNITDNGFDQATFAREKENLSTYLKSVNEDKQVYASLSLQNLYFRESKDQKIPTFGTEEDLQKETAASLAAYYQKMLLEDQIDIFVLGDVDEAEIEDAFRALPFADREAGIGDIFYDQSVKNVIDERCEREPLAQSKLNLGYHTGIYYGDQQYFALQVFNGLFGGFPHSKLFMNVREKEHLAYYASSNLDNFRGFLTVQTGIDKQNREKVLRLVAKELINLGQGKITKEELAQTKAMLVNQYYLALDNALATIEQEHLKVLLPHRSFSAEQWIERIEAVTIEEIQEVAKQVTLQAIFFLEGETAHG